MLSTELQQLASKFGLNASTENQSKAELVRTIQALCGEDPCFSTDKRYNCTDVCKWRQDCCKLRAIWLR